LHFEPVCVRLGVIEYLGKQKLPRAGEYLTTVLENEKNPEVKLAAIIAMGEIGKTEYDLVLLGMLRDKNRYIRYGTAKTLYRLNRVPDTLPDRIYYLIACQDWDAIRSYGSGAIEPLMEIYSGSDPGTCSAILSVIENVGEKKAWQICRTALLDSDARVRWKAVGAAMNCGISLLQIPRMVARRKRTGPNPIAAALLNFLFLGLGYNYIGKWWGFPVFMSYMTIIVLAQLLTGPFLPYLVASPITFLLAIHTYEWAVRISDQEV
jgi:HEAT repeat protein